jgi:hypothetical protein
MRERERARELRKAREIEREDLLVELVKRKPERLRARR